MDDPSAESAGIERRTVLATIGVAGLTGLAGCAGGGGTGEGDTGEGDTGEGGTGEGDTGDGGTEDADAGGVGADEGGDADGGSEQLRGSDYPAVDRWLTETDVGGLDDTYDGSVTDRRESDDVPVEVGAVGNQGNFAFAPSALAVSPGTTVRWVWTGEGGLHNVVAAPDEQLGESAYEFSSGDPVTEAGTEYTFTFDEPGVALYHCEPHLSLGMKGAVVVAE